MGPALHPWVLTGPWYRWPVPGSPASGRSARPALQKYPAADFVDRFLEEPQRSLVFGDEDFVHVVGDNGSRYGLSKLVRLRTDRRKVFLDTHARFYLIVVELHCDLVGFPNVRREQVCEAGFVVRRRHTVVPASARKAMAEALDALAIASARLQAAREMDDSAKGQFIQQLRALKHRQVADLEAEVAKAEAAVFALVKAHAIETRLQGWVPGETPGIGTWAEVEAAPQCVREEILPLYPLIPDPKIANHSARGRSLWFGVLPSGSADVDPAGNPRFDDRSLYEATCFVRRHVPKCPKTSTRRDCPGELVWSRPSERYQLASQFDLDGTSNRPVTVQLPDLRALEAQAAALGPGEGVGVRMVSPPDSSLEFEVGNDNQPSGGRVEGSSICFFAIPLITIVATFVLRLFLPIVVFLFQLWFLLRLKFCIPPAFSIDAQLGAMIAADIEAGIDVDLEVAARAELYLALGAVHPKVGTELQTQYGANVNLPAKLALDLATDFSADAPPDLAADFPAPKPDAFKTEGRLPALGARLRYYERIKVPG